MIRLQVTIVGGGASANAIKDVCVFKRGHEHLYLYLGF